MTSQSVRLEESACDVNLEISGAFFIDFFNFLLCCFRAIGTQMSELSSAHNAGLDFPIRPNDSATVVAIRRNTLFFLIFTQLMAVTIDQKLASGNIHMYSNTSPNSCVLNADCQYR